MSVTDADVRRVAALARIGLPEDRIRALAGELNGILEHMAVLAAVATRPEHLVTGVSAGGMPLREDIGPALPLEIPRAEFAPAMREGFFVVPRLSTHEDQASSDA